MPDELSAEADPRSIDDILMAQQSIPLPRPRPTDLPMTAPPQEFRPDLLAQANVAEYFANRGKRGTAAGAEAAPAQLIPNEQRRSENVEVASQQMRNEVPSTIYPDVGGVITDLHQNPHSREYIEEILNEMMQGAHGQSQRSGEHPFLRAELPKASVSPLAKQLGMRDLREMTGNKPPGDMSIIQDIMKHGEYDIAIAKARQLLEDYNAP